jgi:hypothetical protein
VGLGSGESVSVAVGLGSGDSVSVTVGLGDGDSATTPGLSECDSAIAATPVPPTTNAPAASTVAASLLPEYVKKDI